METLTSIFTLLIGIVFVYGIPIGIAFGIYWYVKKMKYKKVWRLLALLPILWLSYASYQGIYNPNSMYKEHFKEVTGLDLPESAHFIHQENWTFGAYARGYISLSLIHMDETHYRNLADHMDTKGFSTKTRLKGKDKLLDQKIQNILDTTNNLQISSEYSLTKGNQLHSYVALLSDDSSIILYAWHH
ncbi:hypothetical protein [Lacinutrix jangbogonensis]|uniref:hypothetical protein n=1 Tax=Lacinutrix jangbogonensis TaxID=1469557 RepID=UPI00053DFF5F|nr:hypothetical protein [Lacinutrix jangbogonensis]